MELTAPIRMSVGLKGALVIKRKSGAVKVIAFNGTAPVQVVDSQEKEASRENGPDSPQPCS